MRPAALHHLAVQVRDLARAEAFYSGVLGLQVFRRWPWPPDETPRGSNAERAVWLSLGGSERDGFLALEACADGEREAAPFRDERAGLHLIALRIPSSERANWESRLRARGVEIVHRTRWTLYLLDPEGNRIGLSHHPDDL